MFSSFPRSLLPALDDRIPDLTKSKQRFFPPFTFQVFETFFFVSLFSPAAWKPAHVSPP